MISFELAVSLHDAGVVWRPAPGDVFVVPDRDLDEHVFVLSDMVIQTVEVPDGPPILAFNGTTEWALDSIGQDEVVWLPRETQLRSLLGDRFARLEAVPDGFVVVLQEGQYDGQGARHADIDAERAYARALLAVLRSGGAPGSRGVSS